MSKIPPVLFYILIGIVGITGAYLYGKRVADKEARIHELEVQLSNLQKQGSELKTQRENIKSDTSESSELVRQKRASIKTPEQAIRDINDNLQTSIGIVPQEHSSVDVPDAPSIVSVPVRDWASITNAVTTYKVQGIELQGCKQELGVCDQQLANKDAQIRNLELQVKEAKPSRFKQCVFSMGTNAATGTIFAQDKKFGAIGGAAVGLTSCLIFK